MTDESATASRGWPAVLFGASPSRSRSPPMRLTRVASAAAMKQPAHPVRPGDDISFFKLQQAANEKVLELPSSKEEYEGLIRESMLLRDAHRETLAAIQLGLAKDIVAELRQAARRAPYLKLLQVRRSHQAGAVAAFKAACALSAVTPKTPQTPPTAATATPGGRKQKQMAAAVRSPARLATPLESATEEGGLTGDGWIATGCS